MCVDRAETESARHLEHLAVFCAAHEDHGTVNAQAACMRAPK
jgi:hypothetical protein